MLKFILKRLSFVIPTFIGMTLLAFVLIRLVSTPSGATTSTA